jgi:hypothetical protein
VSAAAILDRLERVKQTGPDRGLASCPGPLHARGDRNRSLSWRQVDERLLIHCFAGCEPGEILSAVGLSLSDLFDRPLAHQVPPARWRIPARDLLEVISAEVSVVSIVAADLLAKKTVAEADWLRLSTAASRIHRARDHLHE